MHEDELRALVREAIERHLGRSAAGSGRQASLPRAHPSHARFQVASGGDRDGPCLIEPTVRCSHCGFCQSYGH